MNDFKVGQQVEISTKEPFVPFYENMLVQMHNPTKILGTIVYIESNNQILIHSNQLEEHGLGHDDNGIARRKYKPSSEKGHWWVGAGHLKPYHEQPSFSDLDKLFKEESK